LIEAKLGARGARAEPQSLPAIFADQGIDARLQRIDAASRVSVRWRSPGSNEAAVIIRAVAE
jgi:hypothetical protein